MTTTQTIKDLAEQITGLNNDPRQCERTVRRYVALDDAGIGGGEMDQAKDSVRAYLGRVPAASTCRKALALLDA